MKKQISFFLFFLFFTAVHLQAQYFGRNKPRYRTFDFSVYQTPHFEIYHYLKNKEVLDRFALWAETWYGMHQHILRDTFSKPNPLILYANHADFQQTNAISGNIGVGTGGVTEALKNRVVLPLAFSSQQSFHVLGHEMVHAFQYHLILGGDSTSLQNLGNLPLWMVEGLAEYMSIGRFDPHTAMWMRDAVLQDDVPELKKMDNPKYFPYRYGQAFWAFLTDLYGDEVIRPFFMATAKYGLEAACDSVLQMSLENLSELWVSGTKEYYGKQLFSKKDKPVGKRIISRENAGRMNISPALSPDGRYLVFISEKNVFTTDLFLADARTGEVLRRVASTSKAGHIDDFSFVESAGSWSPDSKRFVFTAFSKGRNVLLIVDPFKGKILEEITPEGLSSFSNPAWSPDGDYILMTGLKDGQVDLYLYKLSQGKLMALTDDSYAEIQPSWAPDGRSIVFASDEESLRQGRKNGKWYFQLRRLELVDTKGGLQVSVGHDFKIFPGANNLNPVFDAEGNLFFLSDRDGYRQLYYLNLSTGALYQLSHTLTGISGLTPYAPAISSSRSAKRPRLVYTHYGDNGYAIYQLRPKDFDYQAVDGRQVNQEAGYLFHSKPLQQHPVDAQLFAIDALQPDLQANDFVEKPYKPRFQLDYIGGSAGVGVANTNFGNVTGAAGGVDLLFSDILGNNQLFSSISLNGDIADFAGIAAWINRKRRLGWGFTFSHIPYRSGSYGYTGIDTLAFDLNNGQTLLVPAAHYVLDLLRTFEDKAGVFVEWPFSQTLRWEAGAAYSFYNNSLVRYHYYYDGFGQLLAQDREKLDVDASGLNLFRGQIATLNMAFVGDNSYFGMASPMAGYRFRIGFEQYLTGFKTDLPFHFSTITVDLRKYAFFKPVALAARVVHYGRYGKDSQVLYPLFLGYPWYIRGYGFNTASELLAANSLSIGSLFGSKILVANAELRLPFTGFEQLALIKSRFLFTELALFADAGLAWYEYSQLGTSQPDGGGFSLQAKPYTSVGISMRINLFGALILEPYYARPLLKNSRWVLGLNFVPGW